jgi:hypothetical protein
MPPNQLYNNLVVRNALLPSFMLHVFKKCDLLLTEVDGDPLGVVTELNTIPHIRSTQTGGVPLCTLESMVFVAHGIVIQSVEQAVSTTLPASVVELPVILNAMLGTVVIAEIRTSDRLLATSNF